jgi:Zn finger protein HypA/HybF involved in hydrogenase expression
VRKDIDKKQFIKVCEESQSMAQAASVLGLHFNTFKRYALKWECYNTNQSGKGMKKKIPKIPTKEILEGKHPQYQSYKLKNRLIEEGVKENRCEKCGHDEWMGEPLTIELHHLDGNKYNNLMENLQLLCPNCHSQTKNFRAKNI